MNASAVYMTVIYAALILYFCVLMVRVMIVGKYTSEKECFISTIQYCVTYIERHLLKQAWNHESWFQLKVVPAIHRLIQLFRASF